MDVGQTLGIALVLAAALTPPVVAGSQPTGARWLIFVDDLHLDFRNTGHLRILLKTIADELTRDGDQIALYCTGPSSVSSMTWTSERSAIDNVIKNVAGSGLNASNILEVTQGVRPTNEVERRATFALSRINEVIGALGPTPDRRTAIIVVSNGYVDRSPSLTRAGADPRPPIFAIDPRLLPGAIVDRAGVDDAHWNAYWIATRNSLRALSEQSGGFALAEGENLAATLARIRQVVRQ